VAGVQRCRIHNRSPESLGSRKGKTEADRKIKEIWSESLGAFANSGGGILIWGIKAKDKFAEGTDLVADARALEERLKRLASDAVDPPILGVEVHAVVGNKSPKGFVVCYIPASNFPPHRSMWADREYYFRIQDGNRPIPTAILRRMFSPRTAPFVVPMAKAKIVLENDQSYHFQMTIDLQNRGMAPAEDISIRMTSVDHAFQPYCDTNRWSPETTSGGFTIRGTTTIHPGEVICWLHNCTSNVRGWTDKETSISFKFQIFARDTAALDFELSFSAPELVAALESTREIEREATLV
jgi:hypothetical protein